jgi:hypothetical protein
MNSNDNVTTDLPPYQPIDILLKGSCLNNLTEPTKGFVVSFPDNGLDAVMLSESEATEELLQELKDKSKYPAHIYFRKCWIHTEQVIFGETSKRKHWSIR